jgi:predicted kinase
VIITHGPSGAGKTTLTQQLLAALGAIRVRSDVERKRLHGIPALARTGSAPGAHIYASDETARNYDRLLHCARDIACAGFPVIVDATFLQFEQRAVFHALAVELGVPFAIVNVVASPAELRARVEERAARADDASEATLQVLQRQLDNGEPLTRAEFRHAVLATSGSAPVAHAVCDALAEQLHARATEHA